MILRAEQISKKYERATKMASHFEAVSPLDLSLESGKFIEITGRSGSGKSTLLYMLAGVLTPTKGKVFFGETDSENLTDLYSLSDKELSILRNKYFGVIPQGQTGLYALNVLQNILSPAAIYGDTKGYEQKALELMEKVGIEKLCHAKMSELSGGEMRRMAIARALILNPQIIFADEPTDDLDDENTTTVLQLLRNIADEGKTVFLVTHEQSAKNYADIIYKMDAGILTLEK